MSDIIAKLDGKVTATDAKVTAIDAKYADLPERVTRLEGKVFPPKRQRRR